MKAREVVETEIPFTIDEFLGVFKTYNLAIEPVQLAAYALGLAAVVLAVRGEPRSGELILALLALFWAWVGLVYHIVFFSAINLAAYIFGVFFLLQAVLLLRFGLASPRVTFRVVWNAASVVAAILIFYAMIIYPVLNYAFGHGYPKMPVFGVAPCPVTIFTFGMLLLMKEKVPLYIVALPFLWSLVGASAAIHLEIVEDYGLLVAGLLGSVLIVITNRSKKKPT